ncbi:hypothetical protein [Mucilaginibacter jinjuensis]|uniref:Uncharacterized protein n=1 Tax=Mucilaginibacter jinjuensis TaxID=1176721 RepID=A0ABY7T9Z9_9SPHI|nr:hypothetical protein [Mucilaginibacter jinjuensis]WCT13128.1 hypothetical protein PQO05_04165 [Mucilaginibacter jinjuensis]
MNRFTFFEDQEITTEPKPAIISQPVTTTNMPVPTEQFRYRCEQTVVVKQTGVVKTHAETKREFLVSKIYSEPHNGFIYDVNIVDNIISFYPSSMQDMMNLMCSIDNVKCNALIQPNADTGKIKSILNQDKIVENWQTLKSELQEKYAFVRDKKTKSEIEQFMEALDHQFKNQQSLIIDLDTKMFFDLFFDKYLVGKDDFATPYVLNFNSQLFNDVPLHISMQPMITGESADSVAVTKLSKIEKSADLMHAIEARYNQRIKPTVGYKFSAYDFTYRVTANIDTRQNMINEAAISILEEIKNNVQLLTNYTLKRVDL